MAYASQEVWVFSGTLRDNILFGLPYSPNWYSTVIETCALDEVCQLDGHTCADMNDCLIGHSKTSKQGFNFSR